MVMARVVALLAFGYFCVCAGVARAEPAGEARAQARALFDAARAQMAAAEFEQACANFRRSLELADGVGTRFNLADCLERSGRTASALRLFMDVASRTRKDGDSRRAALAQSRAEQLEPRLSRLAVELPRGREDLEVRCDGEPIPVALLSKALPVDPGEHRIDVATGGAVVWSATVAVREAAKTVSITVPESALVKKDRADPSTETFAVAAAEPVAPAAAQADPALPGESGEDPAGFTNAHQTAMFALSGAAVIGFVGGAAMGLQYLASRRDAGDVCRDAVACTEADVARYEALASDMRAERDLALVGLGLGAAALAGALYLYVRQPNEAPSASSSLYFEPMVEPRSLVGGSVRGNF